MSRTAILSVLAVLLALVSSPVWAIVAPYSDDNIPEFTGQWAGTNWSFGTVGVFQWMAGSAVAISPYQFLTAGHLNTWVGENAPINGVSETVLSVMTPPTDPGTTLPPDIRLVTVDKPLPLQSEQLYNGAYDSARNYTGAYDNNPAAIMVGYGFGGETGATSYRWDDPQKPQMKRWGTNRIDGPSELIGSDGTQNVASTRAFSVSFNIFTATTQYEAGVSDHDSGGGTFVKVGDRWQLAGLMLGVNGDAAGSSRGFMGDVSYYYNWILDNTTIPGDADMDLKVTFKDYLALEAGFGKSGATWYSGDFNHDGKADFKDYILLESNFGKSAFPAGATFLDSPADPVAGTVPEPATLALLLSGTALLWRRK